jgi:hypothetical protein
VDPADYASDPYNGMGIETYTVYQRLAETHPQLHVALEGVQYAAEPRTQHHGVIDLVQPFRLYRQCQSRRYLAGAGSGLVDAECQHHTKFVMSGYVEVGGSSSLAFYN